MRWYTLIIIYLFFINIANRNGEQNAKRVAGDLSIASCISHVSRVKECDYRSVVLVSIRLFALVGWWIGFGVWSFSKIATLVFLPL